MQSVTESSRAATPQTQNRSGTRGEGWCSFSHHPRGQPSVNPEDDVRIRHTENLTSFGTDVRLFAY